MTILSKILVGIAVASILSAQERIRPAVQNAAFTLEIDDSGRQVERVIPPLAPPKFLVAIRTISTSFVASSTETMGMYVSCTSPNLYAAPSELTHFIPLQRHQPLLTAGQDRFSGLFSGWVPCLGSSA